VRAELKAYGQGLGEKPEVVALNKADALTPEQLKRQTARLTRAVKKTPLVLSAATGAGVPDALRALSSVVDKEQHQERPSLAGKIWHPRG
jgi:GTP-binding protein